MGISFRHNAGFGKRMEYKIVGDMLMEGLDCYMPLVDDHGVDLVIKRQSDNRFIEVQIKARSNDVKPGDAALFAGITHELTEDFYFVFYSEPMKKTWILSSEEFIKESRQNQSGKNVGKRTIWFNGYRTIDKNTGKKEPYCYERYEKYLVDNYERFY